MAPLLRGYLNPQLTIYPLHCEINALNWWENFIVIYNSRKSWANEMPNWKNGEPYFVKTKVSAKMSCKQFQIIVYIFKYDKYVGILPRQNIRRYFEL